MQHVEHESLWISFQKEREREREREERGHEATDWNLLQVVVRFVIVWLALLNVGFCPVLPSLSEAFALREERDCLSDSRHRVFPH